MDQLTDTITDAIGIEEYISLQGWRRWCDGSLRGSKGQACIALLRRCRNLLGVLIAEESVVGSGITHV